MEDKGIKEAVKERFAATVIRRREQAELLRSLGAGFVLESKDPNF